MDEKKSPMRLSWNGGAWFGAQLGGTAWMLGVGIMVIGRAPGLAAVLLVCAGFSNAVGLALWRSRHRLRPYPALQGLVVTIGMATLCSLVYADLSGTLPLLDRRLEDSPRAAYWILVIFPGLMTLFHARYGAATDPDARRHG